MMKIYLAVITLLLSCMLTTSSQAAPFQDCGNGAVIDTGSNSFVEECGVFSDGRRLF